jgi:hypothetical protein
MRSFFKPASYVIDCAVRIALRVSAPVSLPFRSVFVSCVLVFEFKVNASSAYGENSVYNRGAHCTSIRVCVRLCVCAHTHRGARGRASVCVSVCVCVYLRGFVVCVCVTKCVCVHAHACAIVRVYVCMDERLCICVCARMFFCVCVCSCVHVCM